ncbi:MAG: IS66 family insertion sequence element accessory protein TnpA [Proteocatella sp.]
MVYWTLDYFKSLYDQYVLSGVSIRRFCKEYGIKENRFYYWIKMLKRQAITSLDTSKAFIPLNSDTAGYLTQTSLKQKAVDTVQMKNQPVQITYPNGVIVQLENGCDLATLKQLITLTTCTHV